MLDKLDRINTFVSGGIEFLSNQGKKIATRVLGIKFSKCCNAQVTTHKKGIQVEVCSQCGQVHSDPVSVLKRY